MKVWIITGGERREGMDVLFDDEGTPNQNYRALVFSDDKYTEAFAAFQKMVQARIGTGASYTYPGEWDLMAHNHIVARGGGYDCDDYVEIVELRPYDVIGA